MKEKITILIADDNNDFVMNLESCIGKEEDMEVIGVAKDGKEACEMIINTEPDVVLLDVIMPYLDGIGVLEEISVKEMKKKPIFIMLSAVGQAKITGKAISLGAEYYVVKPFDIELLIKRIRDIKFYQPTPLQNNFINREIRVPYIDITNSLDGGKDNLEALVTNMIHELRSTSTYKRISILKRSHNYGNT